VEKMERLAESTRFAGGDSVRANKVLPASGFDGRTSQPWCRVPHEPPYMVRISFDPFSREQWECLLAEVRDREFALASLISSGDLPLEIRTAFSKAKLRFMPERYADLHLECACPDWLKPCKHLVAAWLKFARDFERDPLLLFQLRGMGREELFDFLRGRAAPVPEPETEAEETIEEEILPVKLEPLPADPEAYWAERAFPAPGPESGERRLLDDDIFEKLGPPPFAANWRSLETQLHQAYDSVYELAALLLKR
jgi:uncharacterized Zn finger protein